MQHWPTMDERTTWQLAMFKALGSYKQKENLGTHSVSNTGLSLTKRQPATHKVLKQIFWAL